VWVVVSALSALALAGLTLSHGSARASGKEQLADLSVGVEGPVGVAYVGQRVIVKVTVENFGPDAAQGVTGEYTPSGVRASSVRSPRDGTCTLGAKGAFTCKLGNLASDRSATITVIGFAKHRGWAEPSFYADSATTDPEADNNERGSGFPVWLAVKVKGVRTLPDGTAKLTLYASTRGTLDVQATRGSGKIPVAHVVKQVRRVGGLTVVIVPNARVRAYLDRHQTMKAHLRLTFTPKGGKPGTQTLRVVLKRSR